VKSGDVRAFAHITGGGLLENIPRVLPDGLGVALDGSKWTAHPVFAWLQDEGGVNDMEMSRTFNCGIGMIAIVPADRVDAALATFTASGETATHIGQVIASPGSSVQIDNLQAAFGRG
jgi:phosphoribosylformylglycinamidine cyclo-ligase